MQEQHAIDLGIHERFDFEPLLLLCTSLKVRSAVDNKITKKQKKGRNAANGPKQFNTGF